MALVACFAGVREMNSAEMGRASWARLRRALLRFIFTGRPTDDEFRRDFRNNKHCKRGFGAIGYPRLFFEAAFVCVRLCFSL